MVTTIQSMEEQFIHVLSLLFKPVDTASFNKIGNVGRPAESNIRSARYPQILPNGRAVFRVKAPEAQKLQLDLGKKYDMVKNGEGVWETTTDSLSEGFSLLLINY